MTGAGKTLKVSYGSFSCTLEGFDDPVATLRAITEHFQSLSAPERLFAAEGPVPGPDVLLAGGTEDDGTTPVSPQAHSPRARSAMPDRDADVGRLLNQTIGQMEGAEQRRRLATIGHLKAAVAVTADDPGAGLGREPGRAERYRADLARAMRPGYPPDPGLPPVPDRQRPLLLVPELRVLVPQPLVDTIPQNLKPDQAAAAPGSALPDFPDFADRIGAAALPDLMEAAAAFVICADGAKGFTRPDLMRHLSALSGGRGGSPEDQMRGFGRLLCDGRILRAGRGTFALPEDALVLIRARRLFG
jgi:hypothetical protein